MNSTLYLTIRPYGNDEGLYEVSCSHGEIFKNQIVSGWVGELLQQHFGNKTHSVKVEVKEIKGEV